MSRLLLLLAALVLVVAPLNAQPPRLRPPDRPMPQNPPPVTVDIDDDGQPVFQAGKVTYRPRTGEIVIGTVEPRLSPPDSTSQMPPGVHVVIDTGLPYPMAGITPFYPPSVLRPPDAFYPRGAYLGSPSFPNGLSLFFSSASGGMGMRIGYDRRLSPNRKFTAGIEFLTYGYRQSLSKLGSDLPPDVTRISLISFPVGLRQEFAAENRVVPHLGFGVGPIVRFDHYPSPYLYGYPGSLRFGAGAGASSGGFSVGATIPLDGNLGLGRQSLTLGGFIGAGTDIRFGEHKDFALSLQGRYALAYFTDALGRPGDFSGLSFAVGFGKYF